MTELLEMLVIGALMGMLGQGIRAVAGLKSMSDDAKSLGLSPNDLFEAGRLITSFLIGALIGLASAVAYFLKNQGKIPADTDWATLLPMWAAAAYAGTDFLESFISQYLPQGATGAIGTKLQQVALVTSAAKPSALSIVQKAFRVGFGIQSVTTGQDLSKDLNLSGNDYGRLQAEINGQLEEIHGAQVLGVSTVQRWQGQGETVGDVTKDVGAALPY